MSTPIIEQIAAFLAGAIEGLSSSGGNLSILRPKRVYFQDEIADRTVIISQEKPTRLEMTMSTIDWEQPFTFQAVVLDEDKAVDSIDTRLNIIRSDIEKQLLGDITCGGLTYDLQIEPPEFFEGESFTGVLITVNVRYRTLITDPYTQA